MLHGNVLIVFMFVKSGLICSHELARRTVVCRLPVDVGPCRDRYNRWYFDAERNSCTPFVYGGCAGNMNRFKSFESCTAFCVPATVDDRKMAPEINSSSSFGFSLFIIHGGAFVFVPSYFFCS